MAINVKTEELLTFNKGGRLVGSPSEGTVRSCVENGRCVHGNRDERVHLEVVKIAGRRYTSVEAWERFIRKLNPGNEPDFSVDGDTQ